MWKDRQGGGCLSVWYLIYTTYFIVADPERINSCKIPRAEAHDPGASEQLTRPSMYLSVGLGFGQGKNASVRGFPVSPTPLLSLLIIFNYLYVCIHLHMSIGASGSQIS